MKTLIKYTFILAFIITLIPFAMNLTSKSNALAGINTEITLPVYSHKLNIKYSDDKGKIVSIPYEQYIASVVSAEMPALFEPEALKAQAVAARTYGLKHIDFDKVYSDLNEIGQAYVPIDTLKSRWGDNFNEYYSKITLAVTATQGEIILYNNEPIEAVYHSASGGKTETAGNVWNKDLPYLISVDSSFDETAPVFLSTAEFSSDELKEKLTEKFGNALFEDTELSPQIKVTSYTEAGYVKEVTVGNTVISGTELRKALGLKSAMFTYEEENGRLIFTTKGYGHGAGMSQYGANYLAKEGYLYKDILKHYYSGVDIVKII